MSNSLDRGPSPMVAVQPAGPGWTDRTWSDQLPDRIGQTVKLVGWLHRLRRLKQRAFLILRDGHGLAQVVVEDDDTLELVDRLAAESVLHLQGYVAAAPQAPAGVELRSPRIAVVAAADALPPLDLFRPQIPAQLPTLLDHAAVALRHPRRRATQRVAAAAVQGFRATLLDLDFVEIQTPKLVGGATESGANVFQVDYFGRLAYLAQSPQLYKQILVGAFERVFEVGPVFRAEPHDTPRHLNEYTSLDAEMGFVANHTTVMAVLREVLAGMLAAVGRLPTATLSLAEARLPEVPAHIPSVHFADAQQLISATTGEDLTNEPDLAPAHERWLGEWARREHGSDFLFVVGYPLAKRPFYTHPDPDRPGFSRGFDLLFRGLELVTGGQRLHRYPDYLAALAERGLDPQPLAGYLEAFRHGMPPHGGFAIGLERFVSQLLSLPNLREAALFPRDINRLTP
jgi:nondiscriminating aspartyl-tRNA synthetase